MKYAIVFPGQGSQAVGMGKELCGVSTAAKETFAEADEALGFSLSDIIFNGPEDKLVLTAYTQPAILAMSIAVFRALQEKGVTLDPAFVAGHSLGEYTALVASGVLSLADGVRLVHKRGSFMQEAVPRGVGAMAAILGLEADAVRAVCAEAAQGEVCEAANYNTPVQIVISGHTAAVERAVALASAKGAKRSVMLNVSAPFHCSLMRPVADRLAAEMEKCVWNPGRCPLVANVSAQPVSDVSAIRDGLYAQTYSPVRWTESVQTMAARGVEGFIEVGPGKVLAGTVKKIARQAAVLNVEQPADLEQVVPFIERKAEA
ncbi:ACP S-malonyltransferase [Pyramidobacter sp. SM-530-WT-4B]|uniref:Malonyl CoA-acyl carrier protein transacylase n=1 Tax=Pyramidobacter porci TaxID=2605789 RepID=A0A6L5YCT8_9BACT|nr:ACP S-malonyltransferase [Pyramidobacter porci]MCI6259908.1 ACP S-malonyltransferase [Pyramidobacter sp.]MST56164.1 ACP S-malonyltransferase [Pyramidobacter porci]